MSEGQIVNFLKKIFIFISQNITQEHFFRFNYIHLLLKLLKSKFSWITICNRTISWILKIYQNLKYRKNNKSFKLSVIGESVNISANNYNPSEFTELLKSIRREKDDN